MACFYHGRRRWSLIASVRAHPNICLLLDAHHRRVNVGQAAGQRGLRRAGRQRHHHWREEPRERRGCVVYDHKDGCLSRDRRREGKAPTTLTLGRDLGYGSSPS